MVGALDGYDSRPHAFSEDDVDLAEEVAAWVALAVSNAEASSSTADQLREMRSAMMSRAALEALSLERSLGVRTGDDRDSSV